jgi:hypothetical protein
MTDFLDASIVAGLKEGIRREREAQNLYDELVAAGCMIDHHESDLYVQLTPTAVRILERYPLNHRSARPFNHTTRAEVWLDIPFAYLPWWRERHVRHDRIASDIAVAVHFPEEVAE